MLLGFYHSATHAIAFAARHPERVAGLILFGGATRGWSPMSGAGTQALLSLIEQDWDTFVESATHAWLGWPDGAEGRARGRLVPDRDEPGDRPRDDAGRERRRCDRRGRQRPLPRPRPPPRGRPGHPAVDVAGAGSTQSPAARLEVVPGRSASLFFEATDAMADRLVAFTLAPGADPPAGRRPPRDPSALSPREMEVLRFIAPGASNGQIAAGSRTLDQYRGAPRLNVYRKLDVGSRSEATALAIRRGWA